MTAPAMIAIGTSLGGLSALSRLLASLPAGFTVPLAVVQHRAAAPDQGRLTEVLQEYTAVRVIEAEDKMAIEPGVLYLAPADYHLLVEERGLLALSTDAPVRSARPSIDVLFETAADAYGPELLAVLLTGASADGAAGIAAVKGRGGRAIIEDPATAECRTMPAAALAGTAVDYVLPLGEIGAHLVTLVQGTRA